MYSNMFRSKQNELVRRIPSDFKTEFGKRSFNMVSVFIESKEFQELINSNKGQFPICATNLEEV